MKLEHFTLIGTDEEKGFLKFALSTILPERTLEDISLAGGPYTARTNNSHSVRISPFSERIISLRIQSPEGSTNNQTVIKKGYGETSFTYCNIDYTICHQPEKPETKEQRD